MILFKFLMVVLIKDLKGLNLRIAKETKVSITQKQSSRGVLSEKGVLRNFASSQENTCTRVSFFDKVTGLRPVTLLKNKLWYSCFPVNFVKFSRRPFFAERLRLLLLIIYQQDVLSGFNDAFISKHKKTRLLLFSQLLTMYKK